MIFYPDLTKQGPQVIFSRKTKKLLHPSCSFEEYYSSFKEYHISKRSWFDIRCKAKLC